ncbi:hypothetical protein ACN9ML_13055 [Dyadobacter endophyticus]|uniref:hypothetical protein n=1 Tax=Dyadobacter TaxID=120831 RepID=UPI003CEE3A68
MEKYFNLYAVTLAVSLLGCLIYVVVAAIKHGFQNVQERNIVTVFADCLAICSALKIICLSFDRTVCTAESGVDLMFLGLGGIVMLFVCSKNVLLKFKQLNLEDKIAS